MSNHACEVVPVQLGPHPRADSLSIVRVFGWQVVVRTADWIEQPLGIYIPPDSVVPDTPEFSWLGDSHRIRARRFRGELSFGLLIPAPPGAKLGEDFADRLGIIHYEPPVPATTGGDNVSPPRGYFPVYDVENFNRYGSLFVRGEPVVVTEKIHGTSSRFVLQDGEMFVGSRTSWKKDTPKSVYWRALRDNPEIEKFCRKEPNLVLYGEVFGPVQSLRYGTQGQVFFAAFDILNGTRWLEGHELSEMCQRYLIPVVPRVYQGPFDEALIRTLAEQDSRWPGANHLAEGVVIRPIPERQDPTIGRVQLKLVSGRYLES